MNALTKFKKMTFYSLELRKYTKMTMNIYMYMERELTLELNNGLTI